MYTIEDNLLFSYLVEEHIREYDMLFLYQINEMVNTGMCNRLHGSPSNRNVLYRSVVWPSFSTSFQ